MLPHFVLSLRNRAGVIEMENNVNRQPDGTKAPMPYPAQRLTFFDDLVKALESLEEMDVEEVYIYAEGDDKELQCASCDKRAPLGEQVNHTDSCPYKVLERMREVS